MSSYFWYSITGDREAWKVAPTDHRQRIISDVHPVLVTVLDAKQIPQDTWTREDYINMKYSGPLYFDWDGELEQVMQEFKAVLRRLVEEKGVDPNSMAMYATGGRGFHLEIPMEVFSPKVTAAGVMQLPHIYREMALEFVTPSMDLKIYSGRKGRMWRVPNIRRDNGHYKVQISYSEALEMTVEKYDSVTSQPRAPLVLSEPVASAELMTLFLEKREDVLDKAKRALKAKDETKDLARFKGEFPQAVKMLMAGLHLRDGAGFNNVALQLSIVAHALGKTEDEFVDSCQGLIKEYTSDGRYNSPGRREAALRERYWYTKGNDCYIFSFGALKSICEEGYEPDELRPSRELALSAKPEVADTNQMFTPEGKIKDMRELVKAHDEALGAEASEALRVTDRTEHSGLMVNHRGIFHHAKGSDFPLRLSYVGILRPWTLVDAKTSRHIGMQANLLMVRSDRVIDCGRHELVGDVFESRSRLDKFLSGFGGGFTGTDVQATVVRQALKDSAMKDNNLTYVLTREGVDVICDPEQPDDAHRLIVWACPQGVVFGRDLPDNLQDGVKKAERFVYKPKVSTNAVFEPDVVDLTPLSHEYPGVHTMLSNLLEVNKDKYVLASVLGWFVSCFHRQIHHQIHGQFPLLQIYGAAGSGKTSTPTFFARLFWAKRSPKVNSATRSALTPHARRSLLTGSASIPALIDEFKRSEMGENEFHRLVGELRTSYNCGTMMIGGIRDGSSTSDFRTVTEFERSSPVCLMSETLVDETAFLERCVIVPMSPASQNPKAWEILNEEENKILMGRLGSLLLWRTLKTSFDEYTALYRDSRARVKKFAEDKKIKINERPLTNSAIVLCGLTFLRNSLNSAGITEYDKKLDDLSDSVLSEETLKFTGAPKAEIYKALSDVAWISHHEPDDSMYAVREGFEYVYFEGDSLDLDVKSIFVKYVSWCKARNVQSHFATVESLAQALRKVPAFLTAAAMDSPIRRGSGSPVFRFSVSALWNEDVEPFKSKLLHK